MEGGEPAIPFGMSGEVLRALSDLPHDFPGVAFAFAYGSGVIVQHGYKSPTRPMVDLVFAVDDATQWHAENLRRNPTHYSAIRALGPTPIAWLQRCTASGLYYNTLVAWHGLLIKYGVVEFPCVLRDCEEWTSLYTAGRLHKPVVFLQDSPRIQHARTTNLIHALRTSLLLLPSQFSRTELFRTIVSLSYTGDIRVGVGENPHKVANIVSAQEDALRLLYQDAIAACTDVVRLSENGKGEWDDSIHGRVCLLRSLPLQLRRRLTHEGVGDVEQLARTNDLALRVRRAVAAIVWWPSLVQMFVGIVSAGPGKSLRYLGTKMGRRLGCV